MIHEEICTYEVCKLAEEKGFPQDLKENNIDQIYCWDNLRKIHTLCSCAMWYIGEYNREDMYAAPTQSLLQRWLREEKSIHIEISASVNDKHCFYWALYSKGCDCWEGAGMCYDEYASYELALEDALKYALENLVKL